MSITGKRWKHYGRESKRKPGHVYSKDFKYNFIPKDELPNTVIHIIGSEKELRGEELNRIVTNTIIKLHRKVLPLRPPCPSGRKVLDLVGNPYFYFKGVRPSTLESGRRMLDYMGNVNEYLHGVRPSPFKINDYIEKS